MSTQTITQQTVPWAALNPYLLGTPGTASVAAVPFTPGRWDEVSGTYIPGTEAQAAIPGTDAVPGLYEMVQNWYNSQNPQYYQGNTVAPVSQDTQSAWDSARNLATNNPLLNVANNQMQATMGGGYLNSNPYLDSMFHQAAGNLGREYSNITTPQIASRFGAAGMAGSPLEGEMYGQAQTNLGNTLGNLATNIYGGNYANERNNQMQSLLFSPQMNAANFANIGQLGNIGQQQQDYSQQNINADINKWNFNQNLPYNKLTQYSGLLQGGGNYGTTTSTQPVYGNPISGMIGGGMGAAGLAGNLGLWATNPWLGAGMTALGALGGGMR